MTFDTTGSAVPYKWMDYNGWLDLLRLWNGCANLRIVSADRFRNKTFVTPLFLSPRYFNSANTTCLLAMKSLDPNALGTSLPPELTCMILELLKIDDGTSQGCLGILGVAVLSRWHYWLVEGWAANAISRDLCLKSCLDAPFSPPTSTSIAILCKHFGWICAYCNNKARHPRLGVTGLRLCHACEPVYLPKISLERIKDIFYFVPGITGSSLLELLDPFLNVIMAKDVVRQNGVVENVIDEQFYLWDEIRPLVSEDATETEPHLCLRTERNGEDFNSEEYCLTSRGNQTLNSADAFPRGHLLVEACHNGGMNVRGRDAYRPHITDLLLLREFRYRFDPTWKPEISEEPNLTEYIHFVRPWANADNWNNRPWSMQNFPKAPRSAFIFPKFKNLEERKADPAYHEYQSTCAKIRALFKAFPGILRAPGVWRRCMRRVTIGDAVKIAGGARKKWRGVPSFNFEFQLRKRDGDYDIEFVCGGNRKLEFVACPESFRIETQGEHWKANIVGVRGDQVYTLSKSWYTKQDYFTRGFELCELDEFLLEIFSEIGGYS